MAFVFKTSHLFTSTVVFNGPQILNSEGKIAHNKFWKKLWNDTINIKNSQVITSHPRRSHLCGLAKLSLIHTRLALLQSAPLSSPGEQKRQGENYWTAGTTKKLFSSHFLGSLKVTLSLSETTNTSCMIPTHAERLWRKS